MKGFVNIVVICVILICSRVPEAQVTNLTFPENFTLGSATSSYQIEGAWNISDKGENIWDWWTHNYPENIADGSNGDIACNSYYNYKEDVQIMKDIGFDFYRFSISWSRVLPNGFANEISEEGIQYYKNLTEELLANNIEPVVSIYHWDHPLILEELGGWTNELMVEWFADYARVIFEELGPLVKTFITINEPSVYCSNGYNSTRHSPGKILENMGHYICIHNTLKAHATVYHMYNDEFRSEQQGQIGLTTACDGWFSNDDSNATLINQAFQFNCGWVAHPLFVGDYPEIVKTRIAMISELEGYPFSRLPEFSDEWVEYINGTADFFGLNHYTSYVVSADPDEESGIYNIDSGIIKSVNTSYPHGSLSWMYDTPEGFGNLLRMIRDEYDNPPVHVYENGYCDLGELNDYARITYYNGYMTELLSVIQNDSCNVVRYTAWSLLDNFEWSDGYTVNFGIVSVNFTDPDRARSSKLSTSWWKSVMQTRTVQDVPTSV
ncbi:myrosinase 1-like isoform X1 [Neodiprion fabricii]|uniref:myrosinase 1-like isoform X1 n=1 Tax=Neodiprion fabricii TaxID=2872261 RepID=UPI001ED936F2|nr:myrosinase 1-like isoform X1 [Neodiprion fabricii]